MVRCEVLAVAAGMLALCVSCSDGDNSPPAATGGQGGSAGTGGGGSEPLYCPPGTAPDEGGGCVGVGVPTGGCPSGFIADDALGCAPLLPVAPCPPGLRAVIGEPDCQPVLDCGTDPYGAPPSSPDTQYVDANYGGGASDGSSDHPWTTITDAVTAAAPGAVVAIAAGDYHEDLSLDSNPVKLWGRCPSLVSLHGVVAEDAIAISVDGAEVRGLGITGSDYGIRITDAEQVLVESSWLHDQTAAGVAVYSESKRASATIRDVLVQDVRYPHIIARGADVDIERVHVRAAANDTDSRGLEIQDSPDTEEPSVVHARRCVIDDHSYAGVYLIGSELELLDSVVRGVAITSPAGSVGGGILAHDRDYADALPTLLVRGCFFDQLRRHAIFLQGTVATIERTVIGNTIVDTTNDYGVGMYVYDDGATRTPSDVVVEDTLVHNMRTLGIGVFHSAFTARRLHIRDVLPRPTTGELGIGLAGLTGVDISQGSIALTSSLIERVHDVGMYLVEMDASCSGVAVTDVKQANGAFGDGFAAGTDGANTSELSISKSIVRGAERAGIASFGAVVSVSDTTLECNAIHLNGEDASVPFVVNDLGGNYCGCEGLEVVCKVLSSSLQPPKPPDSAAPSH